MEWVETTGKTVEEAKELALDQLGVDQEDAEFEHAYFQSLHGPRLSASAGLERKMRALLPLQPIRTIRVTQRANRMFHVEHRPPVIGLSRGATKNRWTKRNNAPSWRSSSLALLSHSDSRLLHRPYSKTRTCESTFREKV